MGAKGVQASRPHLKEVAEMFGKVLLAILVVGGLLVSLTAVSAQEVPAGPVVIGNVSPQFLGKGQWWMSTANPVIAGEAQDPFHLGQIDLKGCSWSVTKSSTAQAPQFGVITVMKAIDKASPMIYGRCASGQSLATVTIFHRSAATTAVPNPPDDLRITLTHVLIASAGFYTEAATGEPTETVSLNYQKMVWRYWQVDPVTGATTLIQGGWDLDGGKPM